MSQRNQRYGRAEYGAEGRGGAIKLPVQTSKLSLFGGKDQSKDGGNVIDSSNKVNIGKSARLRGTLQAVQGREVNVVARMPVVTTKTSQKTLKHPLKFPILPQRTRKEKLAHIKLRIIGLKYCYIWERKVFGNVSPANARQHYQRHLLKKSFQQWDDFWWKGKNEWKFNIRADYHNRFRLWLKIWRAWRSYITTRRLKITKIKLAQKQADYVRERKFLTAWRTYNGNRREKRQFYLKTLEDGKLLLKRMVFTRWKNRLMGRMELLDMEKQALQFWAKTLMFKAWQCWIFNYNVTVEEKRKLTFTQYFYDRRLVFKVFRSFKVYGVQKQLKKLRLHSGQRFYRLQTFRRSFLVWKTAWKRKIQLVQFADAVGQKGDTAKKRRMLLAWKHYISLCRYKQDGRYIASLHSEVSMEKKCLKVLQQRVQRNNAKRLQTVTALSFYKTLLLRHAWGRWLTKCENCEELRLMTLNNSVRKHYNSVLLKRMLKNWKLFRGRKKLRETEKQKANEMAKGIILPRYFGKWGVFVEIMEDKRKAEEEAKRFRRECLLAKTYYHWWRLYQESLDVHMLYRMAVLSYDEKLRRKCFQFWLKKARWKIRENKLFTKSHEHFERNLKLKYLSQWNQVVVNINLSVNKLSLAVRHQNTKLARICWLHWTKFTENRRGHWKQKAIADVSFQHRILNKTLGAWKTYLLDTREVNSYVEKRKMAHNRIIVGELFNRWRTNAVCLRKAKHNQCTSFEHWKSQMERKCFTAWKIYVGNHFFKHQNTLSEIEHAKLQLGQGKLHRYFMLWRRSCSLKISSDQLNKKAFEHWRKQTMKKSMGRWVRYRFLGYRKVVLRQQSMCFHNTRIMASSLNTWKVNFQLRQELGRKSHLSLWLWSFTLQRKAFVVWLEYALGKKKRKIAVNKALERRRQWLYKVGVTQWIKFATSSIAERECFARSRHVRLSESVQQCVQRCAMHWKRKTDQSRAKRPAGKRAMKPKKLTNIESETKSSKMKPTTTLVIPTISKRPKPRRPEYLRDSFNLSEIFAHEEPEDSFTEETAEDSDVFPRKWRSDFHPTPAPSHFQPAPAPSHFQPAPAPSHFQPAPAPSHFQPAPAPSHFHSAHGSSHLQKPTTSLENAVAKNPRHFEEVPKNVVSRDTYHSSRDTHTSSRDTRASSRDTHTSSRDTYASSRDTRASSRDKSNYILRRSETREGSAEGRGVPVASRANHVLLPPSSFLGPKQDSVPSGVQVKPPSHSVAQNTKADPLPSNETINPNTTASDELKLPGFLFDNEKQQAIVQLRDRMQKYYSVTVQLRDLQNRLKSLRQLTAGSEVGELNDDEVTLVQELIKKHSEDAETLRQSLGENYGTIAKDLQGFLKELT